MSPKNISVVKIEMIPVTNPDDEELQGFCCFGYRIYESNERELGFIISGIHVLTFSNESSKKVKQRVRIRWMGEKTGFEIREEITLSGTPSTSTLFMVPFDGKFEPVILSGDATYGFKPNEYIGQSLRISWEDHERIRILGSSPDTSFKCRLDSRGRRIQITMV